jgi:hypothetical protein
MHKLVGDPDLPNLLPIPRCGRCGKTMGGGWKVRSQDMTYRDWRTGRIFNEPTAVAWIGIPGGETLRDNPQRILLSRIGQHGTGACRSKWECRN